MGTGVDLDGYLERIVRDLEHDPEVAVQPGERWIHVRPVGGTLPPHGWKLHISARHATYRDVLELALPRLLMEGCGFKFARSREAVFRLNDGVTAPEAVGKIVTVYPDAGRVRGLGLDLVELLQGRSGPRVLSDRRIAETAPVYYRYGVFTTPDRRAGNGRPDRTIVGPDGEEFDGGADLAYRQPPWLSDPFADRRVPDPSSDPVIGQHYLVTEGLRESARGNVYRAVDQRTRQRVIVKQARALADESPGLVDARLRLRNERRVLVAASGIPGVPHFVDHFRHGDDEFLVVTDIGAQNLSEDIEADGAYAVNDGPRSIRRLGGTLARTLQMLHERGILVRDLTPSNVVVDFDEDGVDGKFGLVDFGLAAYDEVEIPGYTRGYAPARQIRLEPPCDTDDMFALGMALVEAYTGLPPVATTADPDVSRRRALEAIRRANGAVPTGVPAAIAGLLDDDVDVARAAFRWWRSDADSSPPVLSAPLPSSECLDAERLERATSGVLADLLDQTAVLLAAPSDAQAYDNANVYIGYAGIGLELLQHADRPGVDEALRGLVAACLRARGRIRSRPGLFLGYSGTDYFLRRACDHGLDRAAWAEIRELPDREALATTEKGDLFQGPPGIGLVHLSLYSSDGDPADLEIADACAALVRDTQISVAGLAHGASGVLLFQAVYAGATGSPDAEKAAIDGADRLRPVASRLVARTKRSGGNPLQVVSWCNGLIGIARALLTTGRILERPNLTRFALECAEACAGWIPRMLAFGQCCGVCGIGDLLVDAAEASGDPRYLDLAWEAAHHLMTRNIRTGDRPRFHDPQPEDGGASWAGGPAGVLGFLRRLGDPSGPRSLPYV